MQADIRDTVCRKPVHHNASCAYQQFIYDLAVLRSGMLVKASLTKCGTYKLVTCQALLFLMLALDLSPAAPALLYETVFIILQLTFQSSCCLGCQCLLCRLHKQQPCFGGCTITMPDMHALCPHACHCQQKSI